jgi:hypothetical protein
MLTRRVILQASLLTKRMIKDSKADNRVGRCQTRKIRYLLANLVSKAGPTPVWAG